MTLEGEVTPGLTPEAPDLLRGTYTIHGGACDGQHGTFILEQTEDPQSEEPPLGPTSPPPDGGFVDKDCPDFATQEEAQDFFLAEGGPEEDPHNLDADDDGIACEE